MNIQMMQPYLFPYLGYFQLIHHTDSFVVSDDVQYISKGWVNRNSILLQGKAHLITFPIKKDSAYLNINQRYFIEDVNHKQETKILNTLRCAYQKAPYFENCYTLLEKILGFANKNVAQFNFNSLKIICQYLGIQTHWYLSSDFLVPNHLNAQEKIIYKCKLLGADRYTNAIGGLGLYSAKIFAENNISLKFIKTRSNISYKQFWHDFVPNLSIIDVMMFNSPAEIQELLNEFDIIDGKSEGIKDWSAG
jgi:hypothetical protein